MTIKLTPLVAVCAIVVSLATSECAEAGPFGDALHKFTNKVNSFTAHNKSQNGLTNPSRVKMTGSFELGDLSIAADEARLLTPVQLRNARGSIQIGAQEAYRLRNAQKQDYWNTVSKDFQQFTTNNEVLVFRIQNKSYDPIDLGAVRFLLLNSDGTRKMQAMLSAPTLEVLDRDAHFIAGPKDSIIEYSSGQLDVVPALTTIYRAVIIPDMDRGNYRALLMHVPGAEKQSAEGRLEFAVAKH